MKKKILTKAEQRVVVAKDALKQIELGIYKPYEGDYIQDSRRVVNNQSLPEDSQIQDILLENNQPCDLCARGALLISSIRKYNKITNTEFCNSRIDDLEEKVGIFSKDQLNEMENAFEGWSDDNSKSYKFYTKFGSERERLVAILKNIIKNKGNFII